MNILQILSTLVSGGAEHFVFELSNELVSKGHNVTILTLYDVPDDNPLKRGLDRRIKICSLHKKQGLDLSIFISLCRFIKRGRFDVAHGHVAAIKYMTLASFICRKARFVATIHSDARFDAETTLDRWSRKLMFGLRSCVPVTVSEQSELSFEAFYGRKAEMIPNGVSSYVQKEHLKLRDNNSQIVFLHPAECRPVKNQELLLKAFNLLLDGGVDAKLVWVGDNVASKDIFDSLAPLMRRNVSYLGVVDGVRDYMQASDAVCLSSKLEGMPMTVIEAFSVGRPVLCTPVGGCLNLIKQGENGMLSDDLTVDAYYRMLSAFAALSVLERNMMADKALESYKDYTMELCAQHYLDLYAK